ncbi:hypothetical protein [Jannaschia sp. 2305UL9-9]|uniref:hypothetical protein n=1 Tax=Jannaschia sp. 2305UL9-9 TaxID=3121638 RepID=UPI003527831D
MAYLPLILLIALLAMTLYFLRATNEAVARGRPTGGMGETVVRDKAIEDRKTVEDKASS